MNVLNDRLFQILVHPRILSVRVIALAGPMRRLLKSSNPFAEKLVNVKLSIELVGQTRVNLLILPE